MCIVRQVQFKLASGKIISNDLHCLIQKDEAINIAANKTWLLLSILQKMLR